MNKTILKAALLASIAVSGTAHALPVSGQGTWETTLLGRDINGNAVTQRDASGVLDASAVFLYDTVLHVTWLRDSSIWPRTGAADWYTVNSWAEGLTVGGITDWRLPIVTSTPNVTWSYAGGTDRGYNVRTKSGIQDQYEEGQIVYNEFAHLFYSTLGNLDRCRLADSGDTRCITLTGPTGVMPSTGDFIGVADGGLFWSGTDDPDQNPVAFAFDSGETTVNGYRKTVGGWGVAVRDGDVLVSPVPEPETYALMLVGLALVGAAAKRKASRAQ